MHATLFCNNLLGSQIFPAICYISLLNLYELVLSKTVSVINSELRPMQEVDISSFIFDNLDISTISEEDLSEIIQTCTESSMELFNESSIYEG